MSEDLHGHLCGWAKPNLDPGAPSLPPLSNGRTKDLEISLPQRNGSSLAAATPPFAIDRKTGARCGASGRLVLIRIGKKLRQSAADPKRLRQADEPLPIAWPGSALVRRRELATAFESARSRVSCVRSGS
jgi:hypothetical protein